MRVGLVLLAGAILIVAACAGRDPESAGELEPIPWPELWGLEPDVREQLSQARALLERAVAETSTTPPAALARAYGETGMRYHAYAMRDAAGAAYRNAQRLAPGELRWAYYLGHLYRDQGDAARAEAAFGRVLELDGEHVPALIHLAWVHLEQDEAEAARPLLERALALDPDSVMALFGLGKVAAARRDFATAVERYEAALAIEPRATEIHYPLGIAYRGLGREEEATRYLENRGNKRAPVDDPLMDELEAVAAGWRVHQNLGNRLFQEGLYEQALAAYREAERAAPDEAVVHTNLGSALRHLGDLEGAERAYRRAVELDGELAMAHFNLGTLAALRGDDAAAIERYVRALEIDPGLERGQVNLANALYRLGRFEEALEHYRRVIETEPASRAGRLGEAVALVGLRRWQEARSSLARSREALPGDPGVRNALARLLAAAPDEAVRDGAAALGLARELLAEERTLSNAVAFAMAAAETGDFRTALEWQNKAIEAARSAGRQDLLPGLEQLRARYLGGQPSREPWGAEGLEAARAG